MKALSLIFSATISSITALQECGRPTYNSEFTVPFNSMAVFGDSFSDVGNIYDASNGSDPGVWSWDGRYSDGRVWYEYFAQFFGLSALLPSTRGGMNYAWGGATTNYAYIGAFSSYLNGSVPSVEQQIGPYLGDIFDAEDVVSPETLHVLFSGYNDYWWYVYRNYTTSQGQDLNFTNVYTTIANEVVKNVNRLYIAGARQFFVANVMNMSSWAEAQIQTQEVLGANNELVSGHNRVLFDMLVQFEQSHKDAIVYQFNVFDTFTCLNEYKNYIGIQNVHDPCHPSQTEDCGDTFSYKFWDWYHPTTHSHQFASTAAIQTIYEKNEQKWQYMKTALRKRQ